MRSSSLGLSIMFMLAACGSGETDTLQREDVIEPLAVPAEAAIGHRVDASTDTLVPELQPMPVAARKGTRAARTNEVEGCEDHMGYRDRVGTITTYIPVRELTAGSVEIREMLPSLYIMVEQGAPRSIACDFENGTSHEYRDMPNVLPVTVSIYEKCSSREPHTIQHYRVWRNDAGGWETAED